MTLLIERERVSCSIKTFHDGIASLAKNEMAKLVVQMMWCACAIIKPSPLWDSRKNSWKIPKYSWKKFEPWRWPEGINRGAPISQVGARRESRGALGALPWENTQENPLPLVGGARRDPKMGGFGCSAPPTPSRPRSQARWPLSPEGEYKGATGGPCRQGRV